MKGQTRFNRLFGGLIAALALLAVAPAGASAAGVEYKLESVGAELSSTQAGAHADFTSTFALEVDADGRAGGKTQELRFELPPGLVGNPQSFPRCTTAQLGTFPEESECPFAAQVGTTSVTVANGSGAPAKINGEPIYNMVPPAGVVARLAFFANEYPVTLDIRLDPRTFGLVASIEGIAAAVELTEAVTTLWGVPQSPVHDPARITPLEAAKGTGPSEGRPPTLPPVPFMTNPTSCGGAELQLRTTATSYAGDTTSQTASMAPITGCGRISFEPQLFVAPTSTEAASATGLDAELQMAQDESADGTGTSELRSAVVTLPPGMTINPSAGDGLGSCSAAEVGFERDEDAHCPSAAKIGSAEIEVPALEHVLDGSIYQRTPEPGRLFRFWLVADELGVHLKLPAEIEPDPGSGRLTVVFPGLPALGGNPQVPVSSLRLHIFGGPRAPLSTPSACGTYRTQYSLVPWSGGGAVTDSTPMQIASGCGKGGFAPSVEAGTVDPRAAGYSPFVFELRRQDGEANLSTVTARLPEGLLGKLGTIPLCEGAAATSGDCDPASRLGSVSVAAGVGSAPLWIPQPGKASTAVYLGGPYKGAPYSLVINVPAQAGPFDLGTVITRAAVGVDPMTTQVSVSADPLPQILEGVPVAYRDVYVSIDRPEFMLNPTDCAPLRIETTLTAVTGAVASPAAAFQAADCAALGFAPKLSLKLSGKMKRAGHPALRAVVSYPRKGPNANIARAQVSLPHSEFLDQANLNKTCTRPVLLEGRCPKTTVYGTAKAWTPLLGEPLQGPVYLVGGFGYKLPALVAELDGQIRVLLVGKIDTGPNGGIRTTFEAVPDAPVSRFVLQLKGGRKYSLLENSEDLCRKPQRADARFTAQSGKALRWSPKIADRCGKPKRHKSGK